MKRPFTTEFAVQLLDVETREIAGVSWVRYSDAIRTAHEVNKECYGHKGSGFIGIDYDQLEE